MTTSEENRDYYLAEQETAEMLVGQLGYWFRYIKQMDQYSEKVMITPQMAKELLNSVEKQLNLNRPRLLTDELTAAISFSGRMLDGRTTMQSIIDSNKSQEVLVTFNVSDKLTVLFNNF